LNAEQIRALKARGGGWWNRIEQPGLISLLDGPLDGVCGLHAPPVRLWCQRRLKFPEKCRAKNPLVGGVGDQPA